MQRTLRTLKMQRQQEETVGKICGGGHYVGSPHFLRDNTITAITEDLKLWAS